MARLEWLLAFCAAGIAAAGCTPHPPLVQDMTGLNTYAVVRKVRCEIRDAIRDYAMVPIGIAHPEYLERYTKDRNFFGTIYPGKVDPEVQRVVNAFDDAAIAYDFTFDLKEENDESIGIDFLRAATFGVLTTTTKIGSERERKNLRNFELTDNFGDLMKSAMDPYCHDVSLRPNAAYPITGNLNLQELVGTFIDLNRLSVPFRRNVLVGKDQGSVPRIADTIEFSTVFGGTVAPSFAIAEIQNPVWRLEKLTGSTAAKRTDNHKLIVALSLPPEKGDDVVLFARPARGLNRKQAAAQAARLEIQKQRDDQLGAALSTFRRLLQ